MAYLLRWSEAIQVSCKLAVTMLTQRAHDIDPLFLNTSSRPTTTDSSGTTPFESRSGRSKYLVPAATARPNYRVAEDE